MPKDIRIERLKKKFEELRDLFDPEGVKSEIEQIEHESQQPDFWSNPQKAQSRMSLLSSLKKRLDTIRRLEEQIKYVEELSELVDEDEELAAEYDKEIAKLEEDLNQAELEAVLNEPEDRNNAILTIHPGAGGTESQDWAEMLMRMYIKWIERKGFKYKILDYQPGEEAGIKDVTILVEGPYAYGYLKAERGIHRLVRISPFDASRRRHTSFASVFVYPEMEDVEVDIRKEDLRIDTFRASGPGGQHMQKNETAVRITHIPTGIVVSCQSERSQHQNKLTALRILKARLYEYYKEKEKEKLADVEKEKTDIGWGHQIRSYVLHPYKVVKDHRTGYESSNPDAVLDGDIDEFIRQFLIKSKKK